MKLGELLQLCYLFVIGLVIGFLLFLSQAAHPTEQMSLHDTASVQCNKTTCQL